MRRIFEFFLLKVAPWCKGLVGKVLLRAGFLKDFLISYVLGKILDFSGSQLKKHLKNRSNDAPSISEDANVSNEDVKTVKLELATKHCDSFQIEISPQKTIIVITVKIFRCQP